MMELLPLLLTHVLHPHAAESHAIPAAVRYSFYPGSFALSAAVIWTVFTTNEYPPEDLQAFRAEKASA